MKKSILLFVLLAAYHSTYAQSFINIGSTKEDVKEIQGEPKGVESYDALEEEIWRYGESGVATITFKNGKVKGFRNYDQVLKIGDTSFNKNPTEKTKSTEEFHDDLQEKANGSGDKYTRDTSRSITGLYGGGRQGIEVFPPEYKEMAEAKQLNPYAMPNDHDL